MSTSSSSPTRAPAKVSFKEQMLQAREDAIVQTVNRLLAEKGFDAMTVDEVAAAVGIAKASLYKHFPSKEDLAAAAMVRRMRQVQQFIDALPPGDAPLAKLQALLRWSMQQQLAGHMPALPRQNSTLRATLMAHQAYQQTLAALTDALGLWIEAAQREGAIDPALPADFVLFTLYARGCDPLLELLQAGGRYTEEQIVALAVGTCFDGLRARG